ncbi:formylglycine-generating enzyme family protein [Fimbriiglobus ruber]|uniref:formylglycine-generating enzyme family protein n=1 Tax=Fimbriiglobus ruber TaxID=1908690 RepID=UPI000B4BBC32
MRGTRRGCQAEAEMESWTDTYACRGGIANKQPFYFGYALNGSQANCHGTFPYGTVVRGADLQRTLPVGSYEKEYPHPWGLCDMHGNVYEWCENKHNQFDGTRSVRGGSWGNESQYSRSAFRHKCSPEGRYGDQGFRVAFRYD